MFNDFGSDAMRWFLMSSPILRGGNLIVTADGIRDTVRQVMLPVWSSYYFFPLYANAAGYDARKLRADEVAKLPEMDRYLLARLRRLVEKTQHALDNFYISDACDAASDFIDVLTNWYIRRSRDRFWVGVVPGDESTTEAFDTLYTVLETLTRVAAPLLPLVTSTIDNCLGSECPFWDDCFVVQARQRAQTADLVVVNHHLLLADLALKQDGFGESLPGAQAFVVDEAHQLPELAAQFFIAGVGTLCFAILFACPRKSLFFCGLVGAVGERALGTGRPAPFTDAVRGRAGLHGRGGGLD